MASKSYTEKLKDPRWQKKRLEILSRDEWTCQLCGDTKANLQVHHNAYGSYNPWETANELLITYCETCHTIITKFSMDDKPIIKIVKHQLNSGNIAIYALHRHSDKEDVKFVSLFINNGRQIELETILFQFDIDIIGPLLNNK